MATQKPLLLKPLTSEEVADLIYLSERFLRDGRDRLADAMVSGVVPDADTLESTRFRRAGSRFMVDADEFARRIVHLLGPEFYADEFREVSRRLWTNSVGGSFCSTDVARMLRKLCRTQTIKLICPGTRKKPAFYRVRKRPRSK